MSDVTVSSFVISLDFVHPLLDLQALQEYTKSNFKKEFIFINALDFVDSSAGRTSRNDSRGAKKANIDSTGPISKGIKAKIDSELSKLLESKKRHLAQVEKQKGKETRKSQKSLSESAHLYGGLTEVVFCIANYPYTGKQLHRLREYKVKIDALIAVKSKRSSDEYSIDQAFKKSGDKSARAGAKRQLIEGADMDSSNNPDVFPPLRWSHLKRKADTTTVFSSIEVGDTIDEAWQTLEKEIGRILKCSNNFNETFKDRVFQSVPSKESKPKHSMSKKVSSIVEKLINGEIKKEEKVVELTVKEKMDNLFEDAMTQLQRDVIVKSEVHKQKKKSFDLEVPQYPESYVTMNKLLNWKPKEDDAYVARAVLDFYSKNSNFNAVAGHQFETMIVRANKKLSLGLPSTFFNWQNWNYCKEYKDVREELSKALKSNNYVEASLEEAPGILWVLIMEPVSKGIGSTIKEHFMPQMIDGVDEWYKYIFEVENKEETKSRVKETTASLIRSGKAESLLIPFKSRLVENNNIYRIPICFSDVVGLTTPYLFADGFKAEVIRDIILDNVTFSVNAIFSNNLSMKSDGEKTVVQHNSTHTYIEKGTLLVTYKDNYSIYYSNEKIVIKKKGENNIIISNDGSIIFVGKDGVKTIVDKNAAIGKLIDNEWKWTNRKGVEYVKTEEGFAAKDKTVRPVKDLYTKVTKYIRNDYINLEEYEDGTIIVRFDDDFVIRFSDSSINYQIPSIPDIIIRNGDFFFQTEDVSFEISKTIYIESQDFNITVNKGNVTANSDKTIVCFDKNEIQIKSSEEVLYATPTGIERFGSIQQPETKVNKKLEVVTSRWGNVIPAKDKYTEERLVDLHKLFCPRFFAIRQGFSATEFIHESQVPLEVRSAKESEATILDQNISIVSFHKDGEEPIGFIKEDVPDKRERVSILKTLQIPKKPMKSKSTNKRKNDTEVPIEQVFEESKEKREKFYSLREQFGNACDSLTKENQEEYFLEIHPPEVPPEPIPPPPVFTPSPTMLIAQAEKYKENPEKGKLISFWDSPEGAFAKPENPQKVLPRPVSPRIAMHDLSTPQFTSRDDPPEIDEDEGKQPSGRSLARPVLTASSLLTPHTGNRMYRTEVMKPAVQFPDKKFSTNFGILHVGDVSLQVVKVQNTSPTKLNYSFTPPSNPGITVITPPGVIASGLTLSVKVKFVAKKPENVRASFFIQTNQGNIPVACRAKVVV